jgi:endonuclease YncB( thermonuclease family)
LVKDIATHGATGYLKPTTSKFTATGSASEQFAGGVNSAFNNPGTTLVSMIPIIGSGIVDLAWSGWTWVRDNLLDQHGCYIQYLTKNGQPMDAGLSFNQGVAVGTHHTLNVLPGILGLEVKTTENGHRRITANDLMAQLGWQEIEIASVQRQVSWWNNYWNAKVLELAGKGPDPITLASPNAYLARVLELGKADDNQNGIIDGDTIRVKKVDKNGNDIPGSPAEEIRLAGIDTPELEYKLDLRRNDTTDKAYLAQQFVEKRLITDQVSKGFQPIVAIRESVGAGTTGGKSSTDTYGRTLAVVFHETGSTDPEQTSTDRANKLLERATAWPLISWDSFAPNGSAYTINWELVAAGFAYTDMGGVRRNDPDRGFSSGKYQGFN